jgi:hypothetical protein
MRKKYYLLLLMLSLEVFHTDVFGDTPKIYNIKVSHTIGGQTTTRDYAPGSTVEIDLCEPNKYALTFQVYKPGITDNPNASVWQSINAETELVRGNSEETLQKRSANYIERVGNNALYHININELSPCVAVLSEPSIEFSELFINLDGQLASTIFLHYTCSTTTRMTKPK